MTTIIYFIVVLIFISIVLALTFLIRANHYLAKMVAFNMITSYSLVLVCMLPIAQQKDYNYLDVAIVYVLISIIATLAMLRYLKDKKKKNNSNL